MLSKRLPVLRPYWFGSFILLLVLLPLPFGANRPWASDLFGVLAGVLLLARLWAAPDRPAPTGAVPRLRLALAALGFAVVAAWALLQIAPFTPLAWHHPLWLEAAHLLGPTSGAISVDPGTTREALVRLLGYVAFFLLAFFAGRDRERAKVIVRALGLAALAYALYGLIAQSAGSTTILWFKKWAYEGFLTSTFVNKNSYATYAGLGFLCSLAMVRQRVKHIVIKDPVLAKASYAAAWFASLSLRDYVYFLSPVLVLGALALTGSRGGVLSTLVGVVTLLITMAIFRRWPIKQWALLLTGIAFIFSLFVMMGGDALLNRMQDDAIGSDTATRLAAYELVKQAITDNPWLGFGLGSFDGAFRLYRDATLPLWFQHAHNDYLEMMMDLGVPAALLLFLSIGLMVSCCLQGVLRRKRDAIYPSLAVAATALVATHSLMDFSMHIPAVAATYAVLLGLGVAQSGSTRQADAPLQSLEIVPKPVPRPVIQRPAPQPPATKVPAAKVQRDAPKKTIVRPSQTHGKPKGRRAFLSSEETRIIEEELENNIWDQPVAFTPPPVVSAPEPESLPTLPVVEESLLIAEPEIEEPAFEPEVELAESKPEVEVLPEVEIQPEPEPEAEETLLVREPEGEETKPELEVLIREPVLEAVLDSESLVSEPVVEVLSEKKTPPEPVSEATKLTEEQDALVPKKPSPRSRRRPRKKR